MSKYNVLIIGSGGREHAFAHKIASSKLLNTLFVAPGNEGTASIATNLKISDSDFDGIKNAVISNQIQLVIVGPELPLVKGIVDFFQNDDDLKNIHIIGPDQLGAMLEGSKDVAKQFMMKYHVPTAAYQSFQASQLSEAYTFLESLKAPYVLKASGLAAGKGVLIIDNLEEAKSKLAEMLNGMFGDASSTVVIEEFLAGIEMSVFVLTDGVSYKILPSAKDYKRIGNNDSGLNTGGMGAVSPVPFANDDLMKIIEDSIVIPTIDGIKQEGFNYKGFVFIGIMNCNGVPKVIEYNCRMGDPETESVLMRIESDLLQHLIACSTQELANEKIEITAQTALTVVVASGGYPESFTKGYPITNNNISANDLVVFHAGTSSVDNAVCTAGGRVLAVTSLGDNIFEAQQKTYQAIQNISFTNMYCRTDIGNDLL
jgi:phosphoribosylamine---glycine ligase